MLGRVLWCCGLAVWVGVEGGSVTGISSSGCSGGNTTELTGCAGGTVLTISGSGFNQNDPSKNVISFGGGTGDPPSCYPLWTDLSSGLLKCNLFMFSGYTAGPWGLVVTSDGNPSTESVSLTISPAAPVLTSAECPRSCEHGTTLQLVGYFLSTYVEAYFAGSFAPSCTTVLTTNTTILCNISVVPGYSGDKDVYAANVITSQISSPVLINVKNAVPEVQWITGTDCTISGRVLTTHGAVLAGCAPGNTHITLHGLNFNKEVTTVHSVQFTPNTEAFATLSPAFVATNDPDVPVPICETTNSTAHSLVCWLEVFYTAAYYITLSLNGITDNNVHRIYTNSPVPDVHNVSGCGDTVNDTLHCMTGTTLVIMGDGFIPSRIGKGTYNTITFEGGYGPPPACSYIRSTVRYLSCTLSVTAGGRGPWEFKITIGDKSASPPFTLTPHIKQPYISLIEGVYCNSYVCESTGGNEAARVITITGHEFAEDPWGNMVLFTGGEVGYNGQAPSCTPLTATARILTCNLVGAPGVSGWWSLTVQVGSTKAYPFHSPVKVIPPPTNNITLDVPKEVFIDEPFTLFVRTSVWSWRDPLSHWGVSNVSLLWWDGSPVRNDAALKGVTSSNVVDFGSDGQYTLPGVGVSLPGHYIVLLLVSMEDSWISVLRATSVVKVLPLSTSVPIVTSASGCSAHSGLKAWCDHGDVLALHGENFGPDPEVIFVSASGGQLTCANSLHDDAVPPLLLICQLDASEPMYKLFTGRVAGAQEVFEVMIFRPSVKTVVVSAEPNEVTSGATVVLRGTGFYLDSARNTIKFVAAEHAAGPVPSCAPGEIVTTSALECTVHCAPATWGWWLLVVNNEMSQVVLNCTTPPKMSPTVNSVEGCSAYNATLIDCAAGTTVTLHGSDFGVPIHNNVVQLQKVQNGIYAGDLPSFCILDAAASTVSMLKCVFTSPPESYGVFTVNVYNGVGWGEAAVLLRLLHGTLAQQGVVFHSGCKGEVTLSSATYKDYCQHGTQLTMLGKGLDWRIEKSTTLLAAVGTANSGAQPTCTLTTLFPVSTQPYPQEYYQSLTCTLYVPLETVGLWSLSINGVEVAGLKLDRMTAPVILSMEPFGECSNATELYECHTAEGTGGLLFVLENPPQEATYTRYRLVGGEGSAPRCTGGMYECVLECDETCSGMWGVVVANTEGGDFVSAVYEGAKVKCYTPATMPVLLSSVSQCEFCSSGTILTVHGSGFDTKDATSNRVHLLSTGSSLSSLYPPNCTVLAVSYTQLTCEIGTHYTTGGFWSVSVMRVTTGSVTNDTNHTIRPFMEPGEAPLLVKGWSEVIHDTGEVVVVIEGKHFNAQLLSNSVTITRTVGSLGPTPTCDLRSSSIVLLRCLVQGTDATHGLWGVELMTSAGAASLVDPVQITAMPIIVNKITGCEQDVRSGNVIYCELQTGFSVQGFNLPGEVVWLWGGSGTPAAVPTCGTLFAQPTSLTCSTIVLVAAAHGLWVAQMGTVYQHMLLYSNPQAPMVVNAVLGDAKNDTLLTLVGDNFHPVYYKNEIVCNVTCVPVAADVDGKKLVVWVYEAKEVTGAVLIGGIIMQWAVVTETLMLERTATATIGDIMLSSATATVSLVEATQGFEFTLAGDVASFNETDFILTVSAVLAADPSTVQVVSVHAASIIVTFHIPETLTSVLIDHLANSSSPLWASIPALLSGTTLIPSTDSPYVSSDSSPVLIVVLSLVGTVCTTSIAVLCWWFRVKDAKRSVAAVTEQAPATPVNKMDVGDNPEPDMMIGTPSTVRHVPSEHDEDCLHVDDSSETVEEERTGVPTTVVSVVGEGLQQTETMCEDFASVHTGAGVTTHEPVAGWDVASGMFGDLTSPSAPSVTHSQGCSLALDSWSPAQPNDILLGHKSLKANPPKPKPNHTTMTVDPWNNTGGPTILLSQPKEYIPENDMLMTKDSISVLLKDLDIQGARGSESSDEGSTDSAGTPPVSPPMAVPKKTFKAAPANPQPPLRIPTQNEQLQQLQQQQQQQFLAQQIQRNFLMQQQLAQQQHMAQVQMQRLQQQQIMMIPQQQQPQQQLYSLPMQTVPQPVTAVPVKVNVNNGSTTNVHVSKVQETPASAAPSSTSHPWSVCYKQDAGATLSLEQDLDAFTEFVEPTQEEVAERKRIMNILQETFDAHCDGKVAVRDDALDLKVALPIGDLTFMAYADKAAEPEFVDMVSKRVLEGLQAKGFSAVLAPESVVPIIRIHDMPGGGVTGLPSVCGVEVILYTSARMRTTKHLNEVAKDMPEAVKIARVIRSILGQCNITEGYGGLSAQAILTMCIAVVRKVEAGASVKAILFKFLQVFGWHFNFKQASVAVDGADWPAKMHQGALVSVIDPADTTRNLAPYCSKQKHLQIVQTLQYCFMSLSKWEPSRSRSALSCVIAYRLLWPRVPLVTQRAQEE